MLSKWYHGPLWPGRWQPIVQVQVLLFEDFCVSESKKKWTIRFQNGFEKIVEELITRLNAIQLMACSCPMTILNPNLLFIIARRHIIHTWISSVASPIFNLVECLNCLAILGPSKSLLWWLAFLSELLPKRGLSTFFSFSAANLHRNNWSLEFKYSIKIFKPWLSSDRNSRTHSILFVRKEISKLRSTCVEFVSPRLWIFLELLEALGSK